MELKEFHLQGLGAPPLDPPMNCMDILSQIKYTHTERQWQWQHKKDATPSN